MADKRITELTNEKLILGDDDYTIVDSNEGTYKYKLKRVVDSIPEPDTTLSIAGRAADAKATGDEIAGVKRDLSDKANTDGTYDGMTVGSSRQLLSEKYLLDEEPYLFRASGGDGSDRVEECIVGGSVAWNQLCNPSVIDTQYGITVTKTNNVFTFSGTATSSAFFNFGYPKKDHVMLLDLTFDSASPTYPLRQDGYSSNINNSRVYKHTGANVSNYYLYVPNGSAISETVRAQIFDLTQMFGSTIADYIYSLEQATAGAGVAWFKKYFPEDYYEYSAPTLRHVEGVSAKEICDSDDNVTAIYPLDSSLILRGIPKLTDGKMWFDGDKYNADGTVERRYGIVDLGDITPTKYDVSQGTLFRFSIASPYAKEMPNVLTLPNIICAKYPTVIGNDRTNKTISMPVNVSAVDIIDNDYSDVSAIKTALSGVMLVYELATPTTEQADPYTSTQVIDPNGTEEFVSTGIVPVGHYSKYLENLRSKIEGLPRDFSTLIAPTEKAYKATRNYTVGSLLIVDNILYKVTSAIANGGTITPNTNVTATTLAAVIAAL